MAARHFDIEPGRPISIEMAFQDDVGGDFGDARNSGDGRPAGLDRGYILAVDTKNEVDGTADGMDGGDSGNTLQRSEEHTSELQSLMRISYAVFCLKKKK